MIEENQVKEAKQILRALDKLEWDVAWKVEYQTIDNPYNRLHTLIDQFDGPELCHFCHAPTWEFDEKTGWHLCAGCYAKLKGEE